MATDLVYLYDEESTMKNCVPGLLALAYRHPTNVLLYVRCFYDALLYCQKGRELLVYTPAERIEHIGTPVLAERRRRTETSLPITTNRCLPPALTK